MDLQVTIKPVIPDGQASQPFMLLHRGCSNFHQRGALRGQSSLGGQRCRWQQQAEQTRRQSGIKSLEIGSKLRMGERQLLMGDLCAMCCMNGIDQVVGFIYHHDCALQPQPECCAHVLTSHGQFWLQMHAAALQHNGTMSLTDCMPRGGVWKAHAAGILPAARAELSARL